MSRIKQLWQQLAQETGLFRRIRYDAASPCDLYLGLKLTPTSPDGQHLLTVRLPRALAKSMGNTPAFRGIQVEKVADTDDSSRFFLTLVLKDLVLTEVFDVLLDDLISQLLPLNNPSQIVRVFLGQLAQWDELFGKYTANGLSAEQQKGLFGELYLLKKLLDSGTNPVVAVDSWVGNEAAAQDFRRADWAIEVKTSSQTTHERLTINGERQLDASPLDRLFLYYLNVDLRPNSGSTLNHLVAAIRTALTGEPSTLLTFNRKLVRAGYFDTKTAHYEQTGYTVRAEHLFGVTGDFPRIVTADLRPGVGDVRYSVSLSDCLPYAISESNLFLSIK